MGSEPPRPDDGDPETIELPAAAPSAEAPVTEPGPVVTASAEAPVTEVLPATPAPLGPVAFAFPVERIDEARFAARYVPGETIARGGMGLVRLYTDRTLGRTVALKSIRSDRASGSALQQRFVQEARVQGQLVHPAIPPVYDLGLDPEGQFFFTMLHVQGATLRDIVVGLRSGDRAVATKFSRRRLLTAFGSLCLAIDFAHQRGILHRDLKPANVMLGDFGETYVLDWGIARVAGDPVSDGAHVLGTPGYMAPEHAARGHDAATERSDVYALGAILFELLALEPLTTEPRLPAASEDARTPSRRAPDAAIPPELDAIVVRATAPEPASRYPSARALSDDLERYLDGVRDQDLRARLADRHAEAAAAVLGPALDAAPLAARRTALHELGRALALDPGHAGAARTVVELVTAPPRDIPDEVAADVERAATSHRTWTARVASLAYLSLVLYLPLLLWAGVRDAGALATMFAAFLASAGCAWWTIRTGRQGPVIAALVVSNLAFATASVLFGALVLVPMAIAVNSVSYAVILDRAWRRFAIACGAVAIVIPFALETAGVVGPSYAFADGALTILPRAIDLAPLPTLALLVTASVATVFSASVSVGRVRDDLSGAERALYLHNWHLRQLAPAATAR